MKTRRMKIIDVDVTAPSAFVSKKNSPILSEDFGKNLDTVQKARTWLTNPHNWHESHMSIIRWNGLLCTVNKEIAIQLLDNPQDNSLPEVVVREQIRLRKGGKIQEEIASEE